ncbi:MAG: EF2563 family selenium-dependent molybdenum hydroxylase system protein [Caldilineaceae bacterium]|nr:EF2563 family selenium-dependent molybdenum hydroxylase system protein [Caldilineaceae bacterium]
MQNEQLVLIKGAGDLATGIGWRLHRCGFPVVMTEIAQPLTVRRTVAFAQAVYDGETTVEGITARRCLPADLPSLLADGEIPVLINAEPSTIAELAPSVLVDAIMAKRNTGTHIDDAPLVVAIGPGFTVGKDCHAIIETHRGHTLGRVLWQGSATPDTGTPGPLPGLGVDATRVLRAPAAGRLRPSMQIGETITVGSIIAVVESETGERFPVTAPFTGVLRGLIHEQVELVAGMKIGDLDPRAQPDHAWTISDKSLAIGGGVLEAILSWHVHQTSPHPLDMDESYL